jgi:hypothetical protein
MRTTPIVAIAAFLALAAFAPVVSASDNTSCSVHSTTGRDSCTFTCYRGDLLQVSAHTTNPNPSSQYPRLHATCGGVDLVCQSQGGCSATSSSQAQYDDTAGHCEAETGDTDGTCSSLPTTESGVYHNGKGVSTSDQSVGSGPQSVDTPAAGEVCAPSNVVCAGPVGSQHVATLPGVGPVQILPGSGASAGWGISNIGGPGVDWTSVGPIQVLGQPVPVVVCQTPCNAPTGAHTGVSGDVTVDANVGSTGVSRTITLP